MTPGLGKPSRQEASRKGHKQVGAVCSSTGCGPANQQHKWAKAVTGLLPPARGIGHLATSSKLDSHLDKRVAGGGRPATIRQVCAGYRVTTLGPCKP